MNRAIKIVPMDSTNIKIVVKTFICGDIPNLMLENTIIGNVITPGPETKLANTTSSMDNINDNSHPKHIDGRIIGKVITKNALNGVAPRSIAASSSEESISFNLEYTIDIIYAIERVTWAITTSIQLLDGN